MIFLYNIVNLIIYPVYYIMLLIRMIKNKEDIISFQQRLQLSNRIRPRGQIIWIHAASIGESMVAITLIKELNNLYTNINFLITTRTLSAKIILKQLLPQNAIHQFAPVDHIIIVNRFLLHWQPHLGIFIESEFWPCLVSESAKKFNTIVLNARLSDISYKRWIRQKRLFNTILSHFQLIATQSSIDFQKYKHLGCQKLINLGNLKFCSKELNVNKSHFCILQDILQHHLVFVASSSHVEDAKIHLRIIKSFKKAKINYYPIIILRHPERREEICKTCYDEGLSFSLRSKNSTPILEDDLYIVDTFGELGLFYSLAYITFIGGSFNKGGHNPLEPAYFNNIIMFGPDMSNFHNIARDMITQKCAIQITDQCDFEKKLLFFLNKRNQKQSQELCNNAKNFISSKSKEVLHHYIMEIKKFL